MTRPLENLTSQTAGVSLADAYKRFYLYSETQSGEKPTLLLAFPPAWHNRYQVLLYKEAVEHGILIFGVKDLNVLKQISWPGQIIVHFHWFQDLLQKCSDEIEAIEQLWSMKQQVINFRKRTDAKLIWTAHNILPHKNNFPETFLELRKWVFNEFDGLHIMHESHQSLLEQTFETKFQGKTFTVPHPLYESGNSNLSKKSARLHFGIPEEAFVFGFFGSIQSYKNIGQFLKAFDNLKNKTGKKIFAICGGLDSESYEVYKIRKDWEANTNVILDFRLILDYEIEYFYKASNVMVLPYSDNLNSGAAFMSASFGAPFLMPKGIASVSLSGLGVLEYDTKKHNSLQDLMEMCINSPDKLQKIKIDKEKNSSVKISNCFFEELKKIC